MSLRLIWILILSTFSTQLAFAQPLSAETEKLRDLFQEFRYQEVVLQAETLLAQPERMPVTEKCEILRLLALSYYARQDMQGALKNFAGILKLDNHYRLDPLEHSPKILAFFEEIRHQTQAADPLYAPQKQDSLLTAVILINTDSLKQTAFEQMALSIVLPGSGQIAYGRKTKGWLLLGSNIVLLSGYIYFSFETNRLEEEYLQATQPEDIAAAWDDYNRTYKNRNLALGGFALLWLYTQIDFIFLSPPGAQPERLSCYPSMNRMGQTALTLSLHF
jgi:hypothetical protein